MRHAAILVTATLVLGACEDPFSFESGWVDVYNDTDRSIEVRFEPPEDDDDWFVDDDVVIKAGGHRSLEVESVFWDADLLVIYCGYAKEYDVDLGIFGHDEVHVLTSDCPPCAALADGSPPGADPCEEPPALRF